MRYFKKTNEPADTRVFAFDESDNTVHYVFDDGQMRPAPGLAKPLMGLIAKGAVAELDAAAATALELKILDGDKFRADYVAQRDALKAELLATREQVKALQDEAKVAARDHAKMVDVATQNAKAASDWKGACEAKESELKAALARIGAMECTLRAIGQIADTLKQAIG